MRQWGHRDMGTWGHGDRRDDRVCVSPQSPVPSPQSLVPSTGALLSLTARRLLPRRRDVGAFTGCGTVSVRLYLASVPLSVVDLAIAALRSAIAFGVCALTSV